MSGRFSSNVNPLFYVLNFFHKKHERLIAENLYYFSGGFPKK